MLNKARINTSHLRFHCRTENNFCVNIRKHCIHLLKTKQHNLYCTHRKHNKMMRNNDDGDKNAKSMQKISKQCGTSTTTLDIITTIEEKMNSIIQNKKKVNRRLT